MRRGISRLSAGTLLLGLVGGAGPAEASPTTTVVVTVKCSGCEVRAVNAVDYYESDGRTPVYVKVATVRRGRAMLRVPTSKTKGMAFEVEDTPYSFRGSVPTVVLKRKGNKGSWCWAGTRAKRVKIHVKTKRWIDYGTPEVAPGHYNLAVRSSPSVKTWKDLKNMHRLRDGGLGTQNQPGCSS